MIFVRRRLFVWLLKAYIKKWGRAILFFFVLGLGVFFILLKFLPVVIPRIPLGQKESIGMVGAYTVDTLPIEIMSKLLRGLTSVSVDGKALPDIASSWSIKNNGKTYIFYLRQNMSFNDGTRLTSSLVNYSFSDVVIERPDKRTIVFKLKDSYSPFLITVSRPIFKKDFVGIGEYKIKNIKLNGNFVESITISSVKNPYKSTAYHFYPTQEALKIALSLGEVSKTLGVSDLRLKDTSFNSFPNMQVKKIVNYNYLVTLFYNTKDTFVSDEKIRNALSYAIPDEFSGGQRNHTPFSPRSWASAQTTAEKRQDIEKSRDLISQSQSATKSAELTIALKTLPKYKEAAEHIAEAWKEINVKVEIEIVDTVPSMFQVFLGDFKVPRDPDQYTLWHKDQENNIARYQNLRIDKLLEDGRKTTNMEKRKKIYADFQKYLLADSPATFLYFPYEYEITKK